MKIDDNNIGKFFQEQLKDVEVQPDAKVWSGIKLQSGISSAAVGVSKAFIVGLIALVAVTSYFVWDYYSINNVEEEVIVEQNIKAVDAPQKKTLIANDNKVKLEVLPEKNDEIQENTITKTAPKPTPIEKVEVVEPKEVNKKAKPTYAYSNSNAVVISTPKLEPKEKANADVIMPKEVNEPIVVVNETTPKETDAVLPNSQDTASIRFSSDPVICFGEDALLQVEGGVSYDWNTGAHGSKIKVSPVENSDYWVIVTDASGREIKHTFNVSIDRECTAIFVPSAFTPNGDGVNDVFKAEGLGILNFEMIVFNREGQIVFESHSIEDAWDGTYRNSVSEPRIYFYHLSYTDAKGNIHKKRGQVTLIR